MRVSDTIISVNDTIKFVPKILSLNPFRTRHLRGKDLFNSRYLHDEYIVILLNKYFCMTDFNSFSLENMYKICDRLHNG